MTTPHPPTVTVVICAYTERRWQQMVDAVNSVGKQSYRASQLVLVIDHNPALLERALAEFTDVDVVPNADESGLSGARNTGVRHAGSDIVAFLDDDALAEPDWLELLIAPYRDADVVGTGGVARAAWPVSRPSWFPPEFDWVVGCSYRGLPEGQAPVRNPIGANMSFRRLAFDRAGGFRSDFGRLGTLPLGCEETEFSIRVRRVIPEAQILHVPGAVVDHFVSTDRTTVKYFLRRCVAEGLSKATVTAHVWPHRRPGQRTAVHHQCATEGVLLGAGPRDRNVVGLSHPLGHDRGRAAGHHLGIPARQVRARGVGRPTARRSLHPGQTVGVGSGWLRSA